MEDDIGQQSDGMDANLRDIELSLKETVSRAIHPVLTSDGILLVNWYTTGKEYELSCECRC
jgi:hypothetical protein